MRGTKDADAPFAYEGLDRVIHEKARLGILTSLSGAPDGLGFRDLKDLCDLTDGNLARHLQALEEAGLVVRCKENAGGRPATRVRLTPEGKRKFRAYLEVLERVVKDAAKARAGETPVARAVRFA